MWNLVSLTFSFRVEPKDRNRIDKIVGVVTVIGEPPIFSDSNPGLSIDKTPKLANPCQGRSTSIRLWKLTLFLIEVDLFTQVFVLENDDFACQSLLFKAQEDSGRSAIEISLTLS
jgi:hypothetical protein